MNGKLITIYGINNTGKSTQIKLLEDHLIEDGVKVHRIKYPLYDLKPTGPRINAYLRAGNPEKLTPEQFQLLNVENRMAFQSVLIGYLENGITVLAEDYTGTGIAWGVGAGVSKHFLIWKNRQLRKEDLAILLDGKRFSEAIEEGHTHESNNELTEKVRLVHLELAEQFGWKIISANQPQEAIHQQIYMLVKDILKS